MCRHKTVCATFAFILLQAFSVVGSGEPKFSFDSTPGQLPKNVIPQHYALTIHPDINSLTFKGSEIIEIDVRKATNKIVLNMLELNISRATLIDGIGQRANITTDAENQTVTLSFPQLVRPGVHKLEIIFDGRIGSQSQGLYHVEYRTNEAKRILLATQMQPTDARRMFPCWDEPVYRSTYQLTVILPEDLVAISNTAVETEKVLQPGWKSTTFLRTPKMSSYLMVLVAGELESLAGESEGVRLRVLTTRGKKETGKYALEALRKLLPYYNGYFGTPYPLLKLDLVAIPGGFSGAMENWGCITFQESFLLYDPNISSEETKQTIFSLLSHEVAHQWFGNLVTMAWWNNLWLNEGFASWIGTKATDHFNPTWHVWLRQHSFKNSVMSLDAGKTTHPVQQEVNSPADAARLFDEITYGKGEALLRMLESFVGETSFREGIRGYIRKHKYSNTTTTDLWDALAKTSRKPVNTVAAGWIDQPGFPLVTVKSSCRSGKRILTLEQKRFINRGSVRQVAHWRIPISIGHLGVKRPVLHIVLNQKMMRVPVGACDSVVKLNANNAGYWRVKYEPEMFDDFISIVDKLPASDRLTLLSDTWAIAEAGQGPATAYLDLALAMREDTSLAVWEEILDRLLFIDDLQVGRPERDGFQSYFRSILYPQLERLTWDTKPGEEPTVSLMRNKLITVLGRFKDAATIAEAQQRFRQFLQSPKSLRPDLRPPVFYLVGRYSNRDSYDQLHKLGRESQTIEEQQQFYEAMMGALDPKLATENLQIALSNELPPEVAVFSLFVVAANGEHRELTVKFAQQHMNQFSSKLPSFASISYIPGLFSLFADEAQLTNLEEFGRNSTFPEVQPEIAKAAEKIATKAAFKKSELPRIDAWLSRLLTNH